MKERKEKERRGEERWGRGHDVETRSRDLALNCERVIKVGHSGGCREKSGTALVEGWLGEERLCH